MVERGSSLTGRTAARCRGSAHVYWPFALAGKKHVIQRTACSASESLKVYPVGTVQQMRPRAELGRQSARQAGIAGFTLSFCAQGFQRERCQLL